MKTLLSSLALTLFLFLFQKNAAAQTIRGQVVDGAHHPVAGANVLLRNAADSSLVKGAAADEGGFFKFENTGAGRFAVEAVMVGFEKSSTGAFDLGKTGEKDLGTLVLMDNANLLTEAVIAAARPFLETKVDRTVVNVANSITNAGGTALQVLERSPGVQVNKLTKSIALTGKQGVVVMVNGKVSRLPAEAVVDMLAGMSADNIDRIELIHTPPANLDAEGNAGVINIILKNTGDAGLNGGYSLKGGYGRGGKYGGGGYFNYRRGRANLYGSYDHDYNLNPQTFTNYRRVRQGADVLETDTDSDRPHTPTTTQNANLGLDLQLSKRTVVGVLGTFFDRNWYMEAVNDVRYSKNGALESRLRMPNEETNHNRSFAGNANLSHQFARGGSLNLDADLIEYDINNPSHYLIENLDAAGQPTSESELRISKKTPIRAAVGKADFSKNIGKTVQVEAGAKLTSLRFTNDVGVDEREGQNAWSNIAEYTSVSHLDEWVAAAYGSFSTKIGEKTDLKAGLRFEHTDTRLGLEGRPDTIDREYGSWFPSVFLGRKISETQSLSASYSRRISRPQIRRLAPWLIFSDPTTLEGGNPGLQPSFTDAFNLGYTVKTVRMGLSYSIEDRPMRFLPVVDPASNRQVNSFANLGNERVTGASLYFPLKPTGWWEMGCNFYGNHTDIRFELDGQKVQLTNLVYGFNTTQTIKLPRHFLLEITGNYDAPSYWGIARWAAVGSLNIGLEKDFGDQWGKLRFNANDLFMSTNWFGTTDIEATGLFVKSSFQMAERVFMLSYSNTFGNRKLKSSRQRQTGAAEEMRRF